MLALALTVLLLPGPAGPGAEPPSAAADGEAPAYRVTRDIAYRPAGDQPRRNLLDVYVPRRSRPGPAPVVVWVHGGGWYQGSKEAVVQPKAELFTRAGFVFVAVNYRLSPSPDDPRSLDPGRPRFPTHVRDVAEALGWVDRRIGEFGGDHRRVVLIGHSAGAQLVSLIGTEPRFLRAESVSPGNVRGVISLDTVGFDVPALTDPGRRTINERGRTMYWNAFGTPDEEALLPRWEAASPLVHADPRDPPFLLVVPETVPLRIGEARAMARALGQRLGHAVWRVAMDHREINHSFGARGESAGQTAHGLAFARAVTSGGEVRPVVRGPRLVRVAARAGVARAAFTIRSRPVGALTLCRIDRGPFRRCEGRRVYRLRSGSHLLRVRAYDFTGRPGRLVSFRFAVRRAG